MVGWCRACIRKELTVYKGYSAATARISSDDDDDDDDDLIYTEP